MTLLAVLVDLDETPLKIQNYFPLISKFFLHLLFINCSFNALQLHGDLKTSENVWKPGQLARITQDDFVQDNFFLLR